MINEKAEIHLLQYTYIKWNSKNKDINNTLIETYKEEITTFNSNYLPFIKEEILYQDKVYLIDKIQRDLDVDSDVFYVISKSEIIYIEFEDYIDYFVTDKSLSISELLDLAKPTYPHSLKNWIEKANNLKNNYKNWKK